MAKNPEPRTQRERLDTRRGLQATARPQATYDNARPAYAERPFGAGNEMESLARSLSQFDRSLGGFLGQRLDKQIEEDAAKGTFILETEGTDDSGNMLAFKELTEKNPEYVNANPYLIKGYEEARLRHLGLKFGKQVSDGMIETGLNNTTDMGAVGKFYQTQADAFRKEHGLDVYADKILLAKTFSPVVAAMKDRIFTKHTQQMEAQNEEKALQSYSSLALQEIENGMDVNLNGGVRISGHPSRNKANLSFQAERIMSAVTEATKHGVRNVRAADMAMGIIMTMVEKNRNDVSPLKLCDMININGVPLNNFASVAKTRNAIIDQHTARQAADISRENAALQRQILKDQHTLPGRALDYYIQHNKNEDGPITLQSVLDKGFSKNEALKVLGVLNSMDAEEHKSLMNTPDAVEQKSTYITMASMGMLNKGDKLRAIQMFGEGAVGIIKENDNAMEGALKDQAGVAKMLYSSFASRFSKGAITDANREEVMANYVATGSKTLPLDYIQGIRAGGHVVAIFSELVREARAGNKEGILTPPQLQSLAMKAELQAQQELNTIMAQMQSQATTNKATTKKGAK